MITLQELLNKCYGGQPDFGNRELGINTDKLLKAVNLVRKHRNKPMIPSCFYRSVAWDKSKGRSGLSQHCLCAAVDFSDPDGSLAVWCLNNLFVLVQAGLWMEDPKATKGWVHFDLKERKNRVFKP